MIWFNCTSYQDYQNHLPKQAHTYKKQNQRIYNLQNFSLIRQKNKKETTRKLWSKQQVRTTKDKYSILSAFQCLENNCNWARTLPKAVLTSPMAEEMSRNFPSKSANARTKSDPFFLRSSLSTPKLPNHN